VQILMHRGFHKQMPALGLLEHVPSGDEELRLERPEQLNASGHELVGAEPVEQQMGRVRRSTDRGYPPACDPSCHGRSDHEDKENGHQAVRRGPVKARHQKIQVGRRRQDSGRRQQRRAGLAAVKGIGRPHDGSAGQGVANWARHARPMMADSAMLRAKRRKSSFL